MVGGFYSWCGRWSIRNVVGDRCLAFLLVGGRFLFSRMVGGRQARAVGVLISIWSVVCGFVLRPYKRALVEVNWIKFNKITHGEAERMKSKRTGKDLPFIKIKSDDPKQAEALISGGLICQKTGIVFKVEEFRITPSIQQCFKCQGFGHKAQNCAKKQCVCGEAHSHKDCPNRNKKKPKMCKL